MSENLYFREANLEDTELLFHLRNDEEVRKNSIQKSPLEWDKHIEWIKKILNDDSKYLYLFFKNNNFIGQVRFDVFDDCANINISINKFFRGYGLSRDLLLESIEKFFDTNKCIKEIIAYIRPENEASIKSFTNIGFQFDDEAEINEEHFKRYLFLREKYEKK